MATKADHFRIAYQHLDTAETEYRLITGTPWDSTDGTAQIPEKAPNRAWLAYGQCLSLNDLIIEMES